MAPQSEWYFHIKMSYCHYMMSCFYNGRLKESVSHFSIRMHHNRIPIIKIRRSRDRLIFIMAIPIPGNTVFVLKRSQELTMALCLSVYLRLSRRLCRIPSQSRREHFTSWLRNKIRTTGISGLQKHHPPVKLKTSAVVCFIKLEWLRSDWSRDHVWEGCWCPGARTLALHA